MPWIRIIKPETELGTLAIRENLTDVELATQQFRHPMPSEHVAKINFTPASAFQFFTDGVPQRFFDEFKPDFREKFGLVVKRTNPPRNVIFRHSIREEVSDNIFKKPLTKEQFDRSLESDGFIPTPENEVPQCVKAAYTDLARQHEDYKRECAEDGLSEPEPAKLPWTEGLFRHKFSDIDGVFVHPNMTSFRNGYAFAKVLEGVTGKKTEFYAWNDKTSKLENLDREKIKEALGFKPDKTDDTKLVIDSKTQAKIQEYQSCLSQGRGGR